MISYMKNEAEKIDDFSSRTYKKATKKSFGVFPRNLNGVFKAKKQQKNAVEM